MKATDQNIKKCLANPGRPHMNHSHQDNYRRFARMPNRLFEQTVPKRDFTLCASQRFESGHGGACASVKTSSGVRKPSALRGRVFSRSSTAWTSASVTDRKSVPFVKVKFDTGCLALITDILIPT